MTKREILLVTTYGTAMIKAVSHKLDHTEAKKRGFLQAREQFFDTVREEETTSEKKAIESLLAMLDDAAGI